VNFLRSKKQLLIIFLSILFPLSTTSSFNFNNCQATLGYWNDNFVFQDHFKNIIKVGGDDFVTTSFWSQIATPHSDKWWIFDLYYNILTNKSSNYRFDLLTSRISVEKDTPGALYQIGTGLVFRGNYGGEFIQSSYHQTLGYTTFDLPYTKHTAPGLLFLVKAEPYFIKSSRQILKLSFCNTYFTVAGPSNFRIGINTSHRFKINGSAISFILQGRLEYNRYYHLDKLTNPLFDRGIGYTLMFTGTYRNRYGISFWMTENQYGQHNPHYGISFSFMKKERRPLRISDILFP